MIESPLIQELIAEKTHETLIKAIIDFLVARFGSKAEAIETELKAIDDEARLQELVKHAATCRTLSSFRKGLSDPKSAPRFADLVPRRSIREHQPGPSAASSDTGKGPPETESSHVHDHNDTARGLGLGSVATLSDDLGGI